MTWTNPLKLLSCTVLAIMLLGCAPESGSEKDSGRRDQADFSAKNAQILPPPTPVATGGGNFQMHFEDTFQSHLSVWRSKDASAEQRTLAASAVVTNGTPMSEVMRLLGKPQSNAHIYGTVLGDYKSTVVNGKSVVAATPSADSRSDKDYALYEAPGGGVICLVFNIVGFEHDIDHRPLVGIFAARTNNFPFLNSGNHAK